MSKIQLNLYKNKTRNNPIDLHNPKKPFQNEILGIKPSTKTHTMRFLFFFFPCSFNTNYEYIRYIFQLTEECAIITFNVQNSIDPHLVTCF